MREGSSSLTMVENTPTITSFTIDTQPTNIHDEINEQLSNKRHGRKSSEQRSAIRKQSQSHSRQTNSSLNQHTELSNMNFITFKAEENQRETSPDGTEMDIVNTTTNSVNQSVNSKPEDANDNTINNDELISTSSHIEANDETNYSNNQYANYNSEGGLSVKTPPQNMQIKDLIIPLEDWGSKDGIIREKKYAVLPSINSSPTSDNDMSDFNMARHSIASSINNQLDFFRDKIEQEADFFADFRVNTSNVKVTPRHDPLPPIKLGPNERPMENVSPKRQKSKQSSRVQHKGKQSVL